MRINYKEKKVLSQEETNEKDVLFAVEETKLQLQSDILATKRAIESKKAEVEAAKTTYPIDTQEIIHLINEVELLTEGVKHLENLMKEFGFE